MITAILCRPNKTGKKWQQCLDIAPEYPRHLLRDKLEQMRNAWPEHDFAFLSDGEA